MIIFGIAVIVTIFLVIFFGVLFLWELQFLEQINWATKKTAKFLALSFLSIILFGAFLLIYDLIKDNQKTKEEITQNLSYTRLNLLDDFELSNKKKIGI